MFTPQTLTRGVAALALLGSLSLTACDSGEPDDDGAGDEELITQVTLTLTPAGGGDAVTITAEDADGDGSGIVFTPASVRLAPGTVYDGTITLRDGINDEDITAEVREEAEEHLFRYTLAPNGSGSVVATDTESDYTEENENSGDYAVGLRFQASVAAGASGTGEMGAILYHFDDAPKTSSTATSDEIDVDLAFPVTFGAPVL